MPVTKDILEELEDRGLDEPDMDSGWEAGSSMVACVTHYKRVLSFGRVLNQKEIDALKRWLVNDDCPGWTGVTCYTVATYAYVFCSTLDSS